MKGFSNFAGWTKAGVAVLAAAALAIPAASAFAVAPDAVPVAEETVAEETAVAEIALTAEQIDAGRKLFKDWSCNSCHALADADGHGHIGPSLDGNDNLDMDFVVARIADGQGAMPGFGGMISAEEVDILSAYIVYAKK